MTRSMTVAICSGAVLGLASLASAASVDVFFSRVNPANGGATNPASQFKCVVSDVVGQPGQATFRFTNNVGIASSISEIYYDSGPLLSLVSLTQSGCNFTGGGANPGNLPGGGNLTPAFNAVQSFSADAQGNPANGINAAGNYLEMKFNLISGNTFASVVSALESGSLRIGLHVRSIQLPGGGDVSDAFVNTPSVVPLPPAALAGGASLLGLMVIRRLRRR